MSESRMTQMTQMNADKRLYSQIESLIAKTAAFTAFRASGAICVRLVGVRFITPLMR